MRTRLSGVLLSKISRHLKNSSSFPLPLVPRVPGTHFSTIPNTPVSGDRSRDDSSEGLFLRSLRFGEDGDEETAKKTHENHPATMTRRPLRGEERPLRGEKRLGGRPPEDQVPPHQVPSRPMRGEGRGRNGSFGQKFDAVDIDYGKPLRFSSGLRAEERKDPSINIDDQSGDTLFQKLKLEDVSNVKKAEEPQQNRSTQIPGNESAVPEPPSQDADEIFKKMKETGLIPNAVAMLDGLCKDGLVQEAMKLFGSMREKGTIPEVVIYTAVVEGFCRAAKFDDAKRIFRKMQKNGIMPNAFSYTVLIQGLCKGGELEDSIEFCREMFEAGHAPNAATFTGLIDGLCREKGLEETESIVQSFRERDFLVDEKAIREHLDKKGPFSPMVWEVIFGKKSSKRPF